jgi:choline dehydrogenase-like flavoprotein
MRITVVGTGAVGGYFGARLARAGEDVVFLARGGLCWLLGTSVRKFGMLHTME